MKRTMLAAAFLSALVAAPAFAVGNADLNTDMSWVGVSTRSRADVQAELIKAEAQGLTLQTNAVYPLVASVGAVKTRDQVRQDLGQGAGSQDFARP